MSAAPRLQFEELLFPVQEVRANPGHKPDGNLRGTIVNFTYNANTLNEVAGRYGLDLVLSHSGEQSENPPYFFNLQVFAIVLVDPQLESHSAKSVAQIDGYPMLIGAARERLLDLTSRAPWGPFLLGQTPDLTEFDMGRL